MAAHQVRDRDKRNHHCSVKTEIAQIHTVLLNMATHHRATRLSPAILHKVVILSSKATLHSSTERHHLQVSRHRLLEVPSKSTMSTS